MTVFTRVPTHMLAVFGDQALACAQLSAAATPVLAADPLGVFQQIPANVNGGPLFTGPEGNLWFPFLYLPRSCSAGEGERRPRPAVRDTLHGGGELRSGLPVWPCERYRRRFSATRWSGGCGALCRDHVGERGLALGGGRSVGSWHPDRLPAGRVPLVGLCPALLLRPQGLAVGQFGLPLNSDDRCQGAFRANRCRLTGYTGARFSKRPLRPDRELARDHAWASREYRAGYVCFAPDRPDLERAAGDALQVRARRRSGTWRGDAEVGADLLG